MRAVTLFSIVVSFLPLATLRAGEPCCPDAGVARMATSELLGNGLAEERPRSNNNRPLLPTKAPRILDADYRSTYRSPMLETEGETTIYGNALTPAVYTAFKGYTTPMAGGLYRPWYSYPYARRPWWRTYDGPYYGSGSYSFYRPWYTYPSYATPGYNFPTAGYSSYSMPSSTYWANPTYYGWSGNYWGISPWSMQGGMYVPWSAGYAPVAGAYAPYGGYGPGFGAAYGLNVGVGYGMNLGGAYGMGPGYVWGFPGGYGTYFGATGYGPGCGYYNAPVPNFAGCYYW